MRHDLSKLTLLIYVPCLRRPNSVPHLLVGSCHSPASLHAPTPPPSVTAAFLPTSFRRGSTALRCVIDFSGRHCTAQPVDLCIVRSIATCQQTAHRSSARSSATLRPSLQSWTRPPPPHPLSTSMRTRSSFSSRLMQDAAMSKTQACVCVRPHPPGHSIRIPMRTMMVSCTVSKFASTLVQRPRTPL